jgi:putative endonuclease
MLGWLLRRLRRGPTPDLGAHGESLAAEHYRRRGARILARNWRSGREELDLVLLERGVLVFAEVKSRTAPWGGAGRRAVDRRKRLALRRAIRAWLREAGEPASWRLDIVEVLVCHGHPPRILHHVGTPLLGRRRR